MLIPLRKPAVLEKDRAWGGVGERYFPDGGDTLPEIVVQDPHRDGVGRGAGIICGVLRTLPPSYNRDQSPSGSGLIFAEEEMPVFFSPGRPARDWDRT